MRLISLSRDLSFLVSIIQAKLHKKQMIDKKNHMIDVIFMSIFHIIKE